MTAGTAARGREWIKALTGGEDRFLAYQVRPGCLWSAQLGDLLLTHTRDLGGLLIGAEHAEGIGRRRADRT